MPKTNLSPKPRPFNPFQKSASAWKLQEFQKHILMQGYSNQANRVGQEKYKTDFDISCLTQKIIRVYKKHLAGYSNMKKRSGVTICLSISYSFTEIAT